MAFANIVFFGLLAIVAMSSGDVTVNVDTVSQSIPDIEWWKSKMAILGHV